MGENKRTRRPATGRPSAGSFPLVEYGLRFSLTVIVAIGVPLIVGVALGKKISGINEVFLGAFILLIGSVIQVAIELGEFRAERRPELQLWSIRDDMDKRLSNIRQTYGQLVQSNRVLFVAYFERDLGELERTMTETASNSELIVEQNADTTEMMLKQFPGQGDNIVRFVHFLSENDFLFDVHARQFFFEIAEMVTEKKIVEVRRLFISSGADHLTEERSKRLFGFHASTEGFDYQVMSFEDYNKLKRDAKLPHNTQDFGIYSDYYVYRTILAAANEIKGVFSTSGDTIGRFCSFFDKCWNSQLSHQIDQPDPVNLTQLFNPLEEITA